MVDADAVASRALQFGNDGAAHDGGYQQPEPSPVSGPRPSDGEC